MLDIVKKFHNKIGTRYKVTQDIGFDKVEIGDILKLIKQESDFYFSNMKKGMLSNLPFKFLNEKNNCKIWIYVEDLIHLEEYNDSLIELETKLNNEMTKSVNIFSKIDCLTRKLHESKEFKELELAHREVNKSIENLKVEIQKAKISKMKICQYYKMCGLYIYLLYVDEDHFHYIQESESNNNILFNNRYIEYFKDIEELSIDDKDDDGFKDFQNNVQKVLKVIKGE